MQAVQQAASDHALAVAASASEAAAPEAPRATASEVLDVDALPHVYGTPGAAAKRAAYGTKFALPEGTCRTLTSDYEEFITPPSTSPHPSVSHLCEASSMHVIG